MTRFLSLILIAALGVLVYSNSLQNGFVLDETYVIEGNTFISSWTNLKDFFNERYFARYGEESYRPLTTLSYFIDYHLWGYHPFGYHLTNIVFHIFNGMLLFVLISSLLKEHAFLKSEDEYSKPGVFLQIFRAFFNIPLLASLLFVAHPVNTEAVNSVGFREEPLFAFFFMCSLMFYIYSRSSSSKMKIVYYIASLLFYLFASLAKEMAIVLPLFIILIDVCYPVMAKPGLFTPYPIKPRSLQPKAVLLRCRGGWRGALRSPFFRKPRVLTRGAGFTLDRNRTGPGRVEQSSKRFWPYPGYIAVSVCYMLVRFVWMTAPGSRGLFYSGVPYMGGKLYHSLLTTVRIFAGYVRLLSFPHPLHIERRFMDISHSILELRVLLAVIFFIGGAVMAIWFLRYSRTVSFAIMWVFVPLLPVSNIIPIYTPMAERYLYLSSMGFSVFISWLLLKLAALRRYTRSRGLTSIGVTPSGSRRAPCHPLTTPIRLVISTLKFLSFKLGRVNKKMFMVGATIFVLVITAYSIKTIKQNRYWHDNYIFCTEMLKFAPDSFMLHNNMGNSFYKQARYNEALAEYHRALQIFPNFYSYYNIGNICVSLGDYENAVLNYKEAVFKYQNTVDNKAYLASAYNNLAFVLWHLGEHAQAEDFYRIARGLFIEQGHLKEAEAIRMFLSNNQN